MYFKSLKLFLVTPNFFWFLLPLLEPVTSSYNIGVGRADITGPVVDIIMMGYGKASQEAAGLHFRLYSRAFIIEDEEKNRVCYVNCDLGMISDALHAAVVEKISKKLPDVCKTENTLIGATHTHSGVGGFLPYLMYSISTYGFDKQNFIAIIEGITESLELAHKSMKPGQILYQKGQLLDGNINRSPTSYILNPAEERAKYAHDTDKYMEILKFVDSSGAPFGLISFYPVHPTSMNNSNRLVSGDNKGYAEMCFEKLMDPNVIPGQGNFVAAFANGNEGDVSPNIKGARCVDTGAPCDVHTSTCGGKNELCVASGPGNDMFDSTKLIGERQCLTAKQLFDNATDKVAGPVGFAHQFIDMSNQTVRLSDGTIGHTCKSAMGYSFAAGTTDGPGAFDFKQGTRKSTPLWDLVRNFLRKPTDDLVKCQAPKPILVATGEMNSPYPWQPQIVPTQILRIGQVLLVGLPGEFTTMSGRRIREALRQISPESKVILVGLSNTYSSYVTTREEYQAQRYEGASTSYGQFTLEAYIEQYKKLARALFKKEQITSDVRPPFLLNRQISLRPAVLFDGIHFGKRFGDVHFDAPQAKYYPGQTVSVSFLAGNPRNDIHRKSTFLTVERVNPATNKWDVVATDANWETKFIWFRTSMLLGESEAVVVWDIPMDAEPGRYRIRHFGSAKSIVQTIKPYVGTSREFEVVKS